MSKSLAILAIAVSVAAFFYSLMGVAMAYWVAAVPGNTPERVRLNFAVWVPAALLTFAVSVVLAVRLARRGKQ